MTHRFLVDAPELASGPCARTPAAGRRSISGAPVFSLIKFVGIRGFKTRLLCREL